MRNLLLRQRSQKKRPPKLRLHFRDKFNSPMIKTKFKRKPETEIDRNKRERIKDSRNPVRVFLLSLGIIPIFWISFGPKSLVSQLSLNFFQEPLIMSLKAGVYSFIVLYGWQLYRRNTIFEKIGFGVCRRCLKAIHRGKWKCNCGGKVEPHQYYDLL